MFFWITIVAFTLVISASLYTGSLKRAAQQEAYHQSLPTGSDVRRALDEKYSGYALTLSVVHEPKCKQHVQHFQDLMNKFNYNLLVLDAATVADTDADVLSDLNVGYVPALHRVEQGRMVGKPLRIYFEDPHLFIVVEQILQEEQAQHGDYVDSNRMAT